MKRKMIHAIKQIICRHKYIFEDTTDLAKDYFFYRCAKCGKMKKIYLPNIRYELDHIPIEKAIGYPVEQLWLPASYRAFGGEDLCYENRGVGYLVSKYYNKEGVLLTAYGNRKYGVREE